MVTVIITAKRLYSTYYLRAQMNIHLFQKRARKAICARAFKRNCIALARALAKSLLAM